MENPRAARRFYQWEIHKKVRNWQEGESWELQKFEGENNFTERFCGYILQNLDKKNTA